MLIQHGNTGNTLSERHAPDGWTTKPLLDNTRERPATTSESESGDRFARSTEKSNRVRPRRG